MTISIPTVWIASVRYVSSLISPSCIQSYISRNEIVCIMHDDMKADGLDYMQVTQGYR
jgi:hypothetical protein